MKEASLADINCGMIYGRNNIRVVEQNSKGSRTFLCFSFAEDQIHFLISFYEI